MLVFQNYPFLVCFFVRNLIPISFLYIHNITFNPVQYIQYFLCNFINSQQLNPIPLVFFSNLRKICQELVMVALFKRLCDRRCKKVSGPYEGCR